MITSLVPKSLQLCVLCKRTPMRTSMCHVCLRTLLDDVIEQRDRHRVPDVINTHVLMRFDWWDRVKVLLFGEASLTTRIECQFAPGRLQSISEVNVRPLVREKTQPAMEAKEAP